MCVLLLVLAAPAAATAGPADAAPAQRPADGGNGGVLGAGDGLERLPSGLGQTNNTTQHEDPDSVSEEGDESQVAAWLANRLGDQLQGSTLQLSQGEYELADQFVTEGFEEHLGRYVDVAGETDSAADDEAADTFQEVEEDQRELVNRTREYERTLREYREAQQADNVSRARRLARALQGLADGVNRSALDVSRGAAAIENRTDVSLAETQTRLEALRREVLAEQENITASLFVGTRLTASTNRTTAAFDHPVLVTGRLAVTNASIDTPDEVTLRVGETTRRVALDDQGVFAFAYRPRLVPAGPGNVTVRYLPGPSTPYLESRAAVELDVEQTPSSVDVTTTPDSVRFTRDLRVDGTVSANDRPVPGVPVLVRAGDRRLGTVTTDGEGSYSLAGAFPADVPDGQRRVTAELAVSGRAVGPSNASTDLVVNETDTSLTAAVTRGDDPARVRGRLTTADGTPVPDQPVRLDAPGLATVTARTGADGGYAVSLERRSTDPTPVTVRFSGRGTNLNGSSAAIQLPARNDTANGSGTSSGADGGPSEGGPGNDSLPLALAGLLGLAVVIGGVAVVALQRGTDEGTGTAAAAADEGDGGGDGNGAGPEEPASPAPVDLVGEAIDAGEYNRASRELYALVRASLAERAGVADGGTHWEFYDAVASVPDADGDVRDALRTVTETYEQAAFAPTAVGERRARTALTAGEQLLGDGTG
ncbi:hypothetical protein [Salinirussus salinus]|uniref:hypothetical protein n=1 Tax=Salinirussus salinus TaxID=1198300 RepID=UPI00135B0001|nr:hypothetical protein [Salinirussus salinus]